MIWARAATALANSGFARTTRIARGQRERQRVANAALAHHALCVVQIWPTDGY